MKQRIAIGLVGLLASLGVATGCANHAAVAPPTPTSWTVSYAGQQYCGYAYSPYEITSYGALTCNRVPFPTVGAAVLPGTLNYALLAYREMYDPFFSSGYWYDTYYAPLGSRYHITIVQKTTFVNYTHTFESKYASQIKTTSAKAKWSNGKTGAYTFPATNAKVKSGNAGNNANTGKTGTGTSNTTSKTGKTGTTNAYKAPAYKAPARSGRRGG